MTNGSRFQVSGPGWRVLGIGFGVQKLRVWELESSVYGLSCRVQG